MGSPIPDVRRVIFTGLIGALCVAVVGAAVLPLNHTYIEPHVDPETLLRWQETMENRIDAQERATERLIARSDAMAQDLRDIKEGINNINIYLRQRLPMPPPLGNGERVTTDNP